MDEKKDRHFGVTRRSMLEAGTAAAALSFVGHTQLSRAAGAPDAESSLDLMTVELQVNGRPHMLTLDPRTLPYLPRR
jgi:hypothetical protein